jgi:adenosylcobyric acid synthase
VDDLLWMKGFGLDIALQQYARTGLVVGICGGMQMLGKAISDPSEMEHNGSVSGLGLLPIRTIMQTEKVTRNAQGEMVGAVLFGQQITQKELAGYEIHIGHTDYETGAQHFSSLASRDELSESSRDGCISADTRTFGTYLHGIFEEDSFRHQFLSAARGFHRLSSPPEVNPWKQLREDSLNRLAHEVERSLDMRAIFAWAGLTYDLPLSKDTSAAIRSAGVAR